MVLLITILYKVALIFLIFCLINLGNIKILMLWQVLRLIIVVQWSWSSLLCGQLVPIFKTHSNKIQESNLVKVSKIKYLNSIQPSLTKDKSMIISLISKPNNSKIGHNLSHSLNMISTFLISIYWSQQVTPSSTDICLANS